MSDTDKTSNVVGVRDVYDIVARLETKIDSRFSDIDAKVDSLSSRVDRLEGRLEGSIGVIKWLGPAGVVALIYGIAKAQGIVP